MHKVNAGLTMLARLKPECVEAAIALLAEFDAHPERLPFAQSATTHFVTITIVPEETYREQVLPATLLFATSFCGPIREHIAEIVGLMGEPLRELFSHCVCFDPEWEGDAIEAFMLEHNHWSTFYSGMQNLSPEDVRRHRQLRDAIEAYVDERQASGGFTGSAIAIRGEIQEFVKSRPELAWAQERWEPPAIAKIAFLWRSLLLVAFLYSLPILSIVCCLVDSKVLAVVVTVGWAALGAFVVFLGLCFLTLHFAEQKQTYVSGRQPDDKARMLAATQLRPVINEFTITGPIKEEGLLRPWFVTVALWVIARVADGVPGLPKFGTGINIPTVATARWIAADGGRRLIFISNYTNEGIPYVRDFIETTAGAKRINLSFGFGRGYPKCRWVYKGGALDDPNAYLYCLSEFQQKSMFWYGPYTDISIDNIKVNRKIREGLFGDKDEREAQAWLHLL